MKIIKPNKNTNTKAKTNTNTKQTDGLELVGFPRKNELNQTKIESETSSEKSFYDVEEINNLMDDMIGRQEEIKKKNEKESGFVTFEVTLTQKQFKKWVKIGHVRWLRFLLVNRSTRALVNFKKGKFEELLNKEKVDIENDEEIIIDETC